MEFFLGGIAVAILGIGFMFVSARASRSRRFVKPVQKTAGVRTIKVGGSYLYPNRHGRLVQKATVVRIDRGVAHLKIGHPHNRTFPRPLAALRAA